MPLVKLLRPCLVFEVNQPAGAVVNVSDRRAEMMVKAKAAIPVAAAPIETASVPHTQAERAVSGRQK